ncbi:MAG: site-2 protease family protein [Candidatus Bathyarchaeota archaeon]|nr:site-2 protease family protein [Candidatus Bathyarchaeota archaeon]
MLKTETKNPKIHNSLIHLITFNTWSVIMCAESSDDNVAEKVGLNRFEEIQVMVDSEFNVEEGFVYHGAPTFYIKHQADSKQAFLRLMNQLEPLELVPTMQQSEQKVVLQILPKPPTKPSNPLINIALFFATLATVFYSGYMISETLTDALLFTVAIIAILGTHEMGHKLLADKHEVDATYPYFIPGTPPIGTFGALIQQKEIPPNKDALFDIGFTGPVTGFVIAVIVTIIGAQISQVVPYDPTIPVESINDVYPLIYRWIFQVIPLNREGIILAHPVAYAGWVGMIVTMLNLVPSGMFDGGHVARSVIGAKAHKIVSYIGIALLALTGWWPMAILALFFSAAKHPGPLDDVSELTTSRKIGAMLLVVIFVVSFVPTGISI